MLSLSWDQVRARRLARNHLVGPASRGRVADVVGDVCGIQAQVMVAAELALAARVDGLTLLDVREELWVRRNLVKTYGPRGTLHLLPARELSMWMAALRAIPNHHGSMWNVLTDVKQDQVDELVAATREVLDEYRLPNTLKGWVTYIRTLVETTIDVASMLFAKGDARIGGAAIVKVLAWPSPTSVPSDRS